MNSRFSKVKLSRKIGLPLSKKAERVMDMKPGAPGDQRNRMGRAKVTVYKRQLMEKQKVRAWYNISEKQMRNYYLKAAGLNGDTGANLLKLLEMRLSSILMRSGLAPTIFAARQYVAHGHISVNGKKVDIPSYAVKPGDIVAIKEKSKKLRMFAEREFDSSAVPGFLTSDPDSMSAKVTGKPSEEDVAIETEISLIVEYYSR